MKDTVLSADGIPVCYEVNGTGAPGLVFVHGWSCDRTYWRGQLEHFAERYQVVAIDLAGHGESGAGRQAWTMQAFGADVVAVVEKVGLADMILIGHSMGGDVIAEAALHLPNRVAGLVWVDVYSTLDEPDTPEETERFLAPFRDDFVTSTREFVRRMFLPSADADLIEWVVADMSSAPPEIALDAAGHAIGNDGAIVSHLRELTAPVLAINPDYRPTDIESLQRHGVDTVLMRGVGHFLMMEEPAGFNNLLEAAIQSLVGRRLGRRASR